MGAGVFFLAVLWTVIKSFEYSPEQMAQFEDNKEEIYNPEEWSTEQKARQTRKLINIGSISFIIGALLVYGVWKTDLEKELYILSGGIALFGLLFLLSGFLQKNGKVKGSFITMTNDLVYMPKTMKQLAGVQFFSWFALFSMWIYTTAAVTNHIYGTTDTTSALYNEGANWVSVCFGMYNGVAALIAFSLPVVAKKTSRKFTHMLALVLGAIGLMSIFFISDYRILLLSMVGIGIAWASILSMPYAILTGSLPANKMGYYMGIFNFFIVIPQIVAATILGFLIGKIFGGDPVYAMLTGGVSFLIAAILIMFVEDSTDVKTNSA
jgi:maltose/moltooligosaccharide transporter